MICNWACSIEGSQLSDFLGCGFAARLLGLAAEALDQILVGLEVFQAPQGPPGFGNLGTYNHNLSNKKQEMDSYFTVAPS